MRRSYAHHDESGVVHALVSFDGPDEGGTSLIAKPGQFVSEVEGVELKQGHEGLEQLRALAKDARVESSRKPLRLTR